MALSIRKRVILRKASALVVSFVFLVNFILTPSVGYAQGLLGLPSPGTIVPLSSAFIPTILRGIRIYPDNPLKFDFMVDSGNTGFEGEELKAESEKIIRYFLASLTLPEEDLWVNLSPYEKDRVVPQALGETEMGREMLAQDYLLKQITASMIYPEDELGKKFWARVYEKAYLEYGTTNVPVNTFNKVWIVPDKAVVYEDGDKAYLIESHLKVMLEEDYLALARSSETLNVKRETSDSRFTNDVSQNNIASQIIREIIIPELEKEVNEGKNFAQLRQVTYSWALATWFKKNLKAALLNRVYSDRKKVAGIDMEDKKVGEKIYGRYLEAFKKGVCDYVKVDYDKYSKKHIPRKYFSGGINYKDAAMTTVKAGQQGALGRFKKYKETIGLSVVRNTLRAVTVVMGISAFMAPNPLLAKDVLAQSPPAVQNMIYGSKEKISLEEAAEQAKDILRAIEQKSMQGFVFKEQDIKDFKLEKNGRAEINFYYPFGESGGLGELAGQIMVTFRPEQNEFSYRVYKFYESKNGEYDAQGRKVQEGGKYKKDFFLSNTGSVSANEIGKIFSDETRLTPQKRLNLVKQFLSAEREGLLLNPQDLIEFVNQALRTLETEFEVGLVAKVGIGQDARFAPVGLLHIKFDRSRRAKGVMEGGSEKQTWFVGDRINTRQKVIATEPFGDYGLHFAVTSQDNKLEYNSGEKKWNINSSGSIVYDISGDKWAQEVADATFTLPKYNDLVAGWESYSYTQQAIGKGSTYFTEYAYGRPEEKQGSNKSATSRGDAYFTIDNNYVYVTTPSDEETARGVPEDLVVDVASDTLAFSRTADFIPGQTKDLVMGYIIDNSGSQADFVDKNKTDATESLEFVYEYAPGTKVFVSGVNQPGTEPTEYPTPQAAVDGIAENEAFKKSINRTMIVETIKDLLARGVRIFFVSSKDMLDDPSDTKIEPRSYEEMKKEYENFKDGKNAKKNIKEVLDEENGYIFIACDDPRLDAPTLKVFQEYIAQWKKEGKPQRIFIGQTGDAKSVSEVFKELVKEAQDSYKTQFKAPEGINYAKSNATINGQGKVLYAWNLTGERAEDLEGQKLPEASDVYEKAMGEIYQNATGEFDLSWKPGEVEKKVVIHYQPIRSPFVAIDKDEKLALLIDISNSTKYSWTQEKRDMLKAIINERDIEVLSLYGEGITIIQGSKADMLKAIDEFEPGGFTPMNECVQRTLPRITGRNVVILNPSDLAPTDKSVNDFLENILSNMIANDQRYKVLVPKKTTYAGIIGLTGQMRPEPQDLDFAGKLAYFNLAAATHSEKPDEKFVYTNGKDVFNIFINAVNENLFSALGLVKVPKFIEVTSTLEDGTKKIEAFRVVQAAEEERRLKELKDRNEKELETIKAEKGIGIKDKHTFYSKEIFKDAKINPAKEMEEQIQELLQAVDFKIAYLKNMGEGKENKIVIQAPVVSSGVEAGDVDQAMRADPTGGIDLNAKELEMETRGRGMDFTLPANIENMDPAQIPGFIPTIINIMPVTNISEFWDGSLSDDLALK